MKNRSTKAFPATLSPLMVEDAVLAALREDLGLAGDITSDATIPENAKAVAVMNCRENGIIAGIAIAQKAFELIEPKLKFKALVKDGDRVKPGSDVARIEGRARSILAAERVALNFICHLSGIATYTARFADEIAHTRAKVCCTRKTIQGLEHSKNMLLNAAAVQIIGTDWMTPILIKDNHIAVSGGVQKAINAARAFAGHLIKIEVEVDTIAQLKQALKAKPDVVMLDNMSNKNLRKGVELVAGSIPVEASGNVSLQTIREIAETGVDMISTSKITMSAPTLDLGLDVKIS